MTSPEHVEGTRWLEQHQATCKAQRKKGPTILVGSGAAVTVQGDGFIDSAFSEGDRRQMTTTRTIRCLGCGAHWSKTWTEKNLGSRGINHG